MSVPARSALLVTQNLERAGAQRQCVELALGLRAAGWAVEVAVLEGDGPLERELASARLPVVRFPRRWRWDLSPALAVARRVRRSRPDVVHTFLFLPNFYGRIARLLRRPPVLISSLRSTGIEGWPRYAAEVLLAPLCDAVIANSEAGRDDLAAHGVRADRILVVRNGLDFSRFDAAAASPGSGDGIPRIGMVAQMESRKDPLGLIEAFDRARTRVPGLRLILAGDGSLRRPAEAMVRDRGLEEVVAFPGTVERPETILATLEVYVQASAREEGTSNSILEAMASARPVVATDIGGNREVIVHGRTGLIVPPRDPRALADALVGLFQDLTRARRMGAAGAERARSLYSRDTMVEATRRIYEDLLRRRAGRGR